MIAETGSAPLAPAVLHGRARAPNDSVDGTKRPPTIRRQEVPPAAVKALTTIFIVDDQPFVRSGVRATLEEAGWNVVAFDGCEAFLAAYRPGPGSCLILDAHFPGMDGLELVARLRGNHDDMPVVMISSTSDVPTAVAAMKAGVQDFLQKPVRSDMLVAAVASALRQAFAHHHDLTETRLAASRIALLTERQLEVMNLVVAGCPSKVIAYELGISQRTVETHRAAIMRRTGATSIPALARMVADSLRFLKVEV